MKLTEEKKEKILNTINSIREQSKQLEQTLDNVYTKPYDIDYEREFVNVCNDIQRSVKEAVAETGYYKNLETGYRAHYAPEELEGDASDLTELVSGEIARIENEIEDIKLSSPRPSYNITTKEEWLITVERAKTYFREVYEDAKAFNNEETDSTWKMNIAETVVIIDEHITNAAAGFMMGPVGIYKNTAIEALTHSFDSLEQMRRDILVKAKLRDMILYMTYERAGQYFWRGAFVNKE